MSPNNKLVRFDFESDIPSFRFDGVTLQYGRNIVVRDVSVSFQSSTLTAVVGSNGSGKSTLLKAAAGLLKPSIGAVVSGYRRLAYLPQQQEIDLSFPARVVDLVSLGFWQTHGLSRKLTLHDRIKRSRCLENVGLGGLEERPLASLSGGQLQRALFARAMLQDADLILLDEPFNAVDSETIGDLVVILKNWAAEGRSVVCVLHDDTLVQQHFQRTIVVAQKSVYKVPYSGSPARAKWP